MVAGSLVDLNKLSPRFSFPSVESFDEMAVRSLSWHTLLAWNAIQEAHRAVSVHQRGMELAPFGRT